MTFAVVVQIGVEAGFISREFVGQTSPKRAIGWAKWWGATLAPKQSAPVTIAVYRGGAGAEKIYEEVSR